MRGQCRFNHANKLVRRFGQRPVRQMHLVDVGRNLGINDGVGYEPPEVGIVLKSDAGQNRNPVRPVDEFERGTKTVDVHHAVWPHGLATHMGVKLATDGVSDSRQNKLEILQIRETTRPGRHELRGLAGDQHDGITHEKAKPQFRQ
ncbi:MAG: hypothetical protein JWR80_5206 [Bradyrhizobium sp.]|nr:hypothetical protein [Bradyrhizobium sp.]